MARVFLSYSRQDQARAKAIATALERNGHEVWWDRHLEGGSRYATEIEGELKRADAVVVLWSQASVQSPWVQDEAAEGRNSGRLVPVVIDDSQPPLGFRQFQAVDLAEWSGRAGAKALEAVERAIKSRLAGKQDAGSAAPVARRRPIAGWLSRPAVLAALAALALVIAGAVYWMSSSGGPIRPDLRVRLAAFTSLSPTIPASMPQALREEVLSAFGTDALITATAGDHRSSDDPAAYALAGSVRQVGDELRFTMHLTDETSGDTLWTQMLKRPMASADVAPRQIAVAVSQIVRCGLTGKAQHERPLPDKTLSTFLSYCQEYMADSAGNVFNPARGLDIARRVVEESPDFSRGWSARAWSAARKAREPGVDAEALRSEARMAAERAIELDRTNAQAFEVLAGLEPRNSVAREKLHIQSVSVRPGDCGCEYVNYGGFLLNVGRVQSSTSAFKRARDMVPLSADVNAELAQALFIAGRAADARSVVEDLLEVWPNDPVRELLVRTAFWTKNYDEALEVLADPQSQFSQQERQAYSSALRAHQSGGTGQRATAVALLLDLDEATARRPLQITALSALGANREALAMMDRLVGAAGSREQHLFFEPPFQQIRQSPAFAAIVQRIGLMQYWRQAKRPPDFCREPNAPALCRSLG